MSRATIYRMFPGGKDVLFEALRVRELEEFFAVLRARGRRRRRRSRTCSCAPSSPPPSELRADEHLALMLASEPGEALGQLTVEGVPRIIRFADSCSSPRSPSRTSTAQQTR